MNRVSIIGILALIVVFAGVYITLYTPQPVKPAAVALPIVSTTTPEEIATTTPPEETEETPIVPTQEPLLEEEQLVTPAPQETKNEEVESVVPLYTTPIIPFDTLNAQVASAVVNIFCLPSGGSPLQHGATGSGVIIDHRGVILTNAHVAQHVLFSEKPELRVSCTVRIGAPAKPRYTVEVLAFPNTWAVEHASDLKLESPSGTGENDWALLYITGRTDGSIKPTTFPFVSFDTRHGITVPNDPALVYAYPAGFLRGSSITRDLWPTSSVITIGRVYTFVANTIDLLSLGGSVVAQSGASGGGVFNQWGKLVGIVVTSSVADTTGERDLRAITLSHIDQSVYNTVGQHLLEVLQSGDFDARTASFKQHILPYLLENYSF